MSVMNSHYDPNNYEFNYHYGISADVNNLEIHSSHGLSALISYRVNYVLVENEMEMTRG